MVEYLVLVFALYLNRALTHQYAFPHFFIKEEYGPLPIYIYIHLHWFDFSIFFINNPCEFILISQKETKA